MIYRNERTKSGPLHGPRNVFWVAVLLVVLVLGAFDVQYDGIRLVYPFIPLTFLFPGARNFALTKEFRFILLALAVLTYGWVLRVVSGLETESTIRFGLNLIMLMIFSRNIFMFMSGMSNRKLIGLFGVLGYFFVFLLIIDVISELTLGRSVFSVLGGSSESYLLGQILTTEPNWLSNYLVFTTLSALILYRLNSVLPLMAAVVFQLLLNPSRIAIFALILGLARRKGQVLIVLLVSTLAVLLLIYSDLMPNSLIYDLGGDVEKNPRIYDFLFIDGQITEFRNKLIGSGFGNIYHVTSSMTWRENYFVSNQLWLHVYVNFGYVGVVAMLIWSIKVIALSPRKSLPIKALLFISLQIHNSMLLPSFWILVALVVTADNKIASNIDK